MYRFVRAGVYAGLLQITLVTVVAVVAGIVWNLRLDPGVAKSQLVSEHRAAVALVFVLMAAVISMLRTRAVTETAQQLAKGYRRINQRHPKRAAATLVTQLLLASLGLVAIALRSPPDWFQSLATLLIGSDSSIFAWPGMVSIGIAIFGAIGHAAILGSPE